jgi:hypothetical protein
MTVMKHYDLADWVDYSRGLGAEPVRAAMERHVSDGCRSCLSIRAAADQITKVMATERAFEPPEGVIRQARAIFARFRPAHVFSLPRILARLVEDSLGHLQPVGVRGHGRCTRRALYRADDVVVDLRIEQRPGQTAVALVGQWLPGDDARAPMAPRPVVLTAGRRILMTTATNVHGEFHLEYEPAGRMQLHIAAADGQRRIQISLAGLHPEPRG